MATTKTELKLRDLTVKMVNALQDGIEDGDLKPQGKGLTLPPVLLDDGTIVKLWMDWPLTKQQWAQVAREELLADSGGV
jgi:hypothetical protein